MIRNIPLGVIASSLLGQGSGGGGPTAPKTPWTFDSRYLDASHSLADADKTVKNDTGSLNFNSVFTVQSLDVTDTNTYYWEWDITAGDPSFSGALGVGAVNDFPDFLIEEIGEAGGMGYTSPGTIRHQGVNLASSLSNFGAPDVVMMAFKPSTGEMWVGVNGTWDHDPDVDSATATANTSPKFWKVGASPSDPNRSVTLISEASNFNYTPPNVCKPLEEALITEELTVKAMAVVTVESLKPTDNLGVRGMRVITVVEE